MYNRSTQQANKSHGHDHQGGGVLYQIFGTRVQHAKHNWTQSDLRYCEKKVTQLQIKIDNTPVDRVYEFNFLCLTINQNLNWKSHITIIANKISKSIGILSKLKYFHYYY